MLGLALQGLAVPPAGAGELVMLETRSCPECARFKKEVGPGYPASRAGRVLPLRSLDLDRDEMDVVLTGRVVMTPTFVFVEHGIEIARLTGYLGAERFRAILDAVAERLIASGAVDAKP